MEIEYKEDALVTDHADGNDLAEVLDVIGGHILGYHRDENTLIFEIETDDNKETELKVCV